MTGLDRTRLRALDLPVEELSVEELAWQLAAAEIEDARNGDDGAQPIDVTTHAGRWLILDGIDRLREAIELERPTVPVRKVPTWALPLIVAAS